MICNAWMLRRGCSFITAAAITGAALAGMAGLALAAKVSSGAPTVIYQDSFSGSTTTTTLQVTPIADYHVLQFQPQRVQSP
ncbi:MAG: hypothetical protein ACP5I8_14820, partial [Phycisphaerae bacterium]